MGAVRPEIDHFIHLQPSEKDVNAGSAIAPVASGEFARTEQPPEKEKIAFP
jgi:hypothetical protein